MKFSEAIKLSKQKFPQNMKHFKVCSNFEMDVFSTYLRGFGSKDSVEYKVYLSGYQNLESSLFNLANEKMDGALVIFQIDDLFPELSYRTAMKWTYRVLQDIIEEADDRIQKYMDRIFSLIGEADFPILILPPLLEAPPLGNNEKGIGHTNISFLNIKIEAKLYEYATKFHHVEVINTRSSFAGISYDDLRDSTMFFEAGNPFSTVAISCLAETVHKWFYRRIETKKLLITDLDNTLWRGIVGEDGPENISSRPEGKTYHHYVYQNFLKLLTTEGIILAICSKNNPPDVDNFLNNPRQMKAAGIYLKKEDFVEISSSWEPKSQQIKDICKKLNVLPSSVVFVDDNPVELFEVKKELPEVEAIEFPSSKDIHEFLKSLRNMFSSANITKEDEERSNLYRVKNETEKFQTNFESYNQFLLSMDMKVSFTIIHQKEEKRPLQLYNKVNQFNLTGVRLGEEQWTEYINHPNKFCVSGSYRDQFGDHGVIFVALLEMEDNLLTIENVVLSCRVFNRGIEIAFLDWLQQYFDAIKGIKGKLIETEKNTPCQNYFIDNGFSFDKEEGKFKIYSTDQFDFKHHYLKLET